MPTFFGPYKPGLASVFLAGAEINPQKKIEKCARSCAVVCKKLRTWLETTIYLGCSGLSSEILGASAQEVAHFQMLVLAALLAGAVTSVVGVIGFVGLVAPHVARLLVGEDQRFTIGVTIACGIIFVTLASLASKLIVPGAVLPIGMVTSLIGLPFFIILILRDRRLTSR
ncbi:iron chelate uptake ABC transporter family permease subunit [Pseudomonas sp. OV226]|uniref:iron chelate uptake ABC transporter family permease subunit n=1 Tax=Pseudomonas sp. OV226 TaxID=2135588 RepID=UPI000D6CEB07|nr:iron chelate uptake ABC transporter family permease subunit [Pseudomonas sp. OV226]